MYDEPGEGRRPPLSNDAWLGVVQSLPMTPAMRTCLQASRDAPGLFWKLLAAFGGVGIFLGLVILRMTIWPTVLSSLANMIIGGLIGAAGGILLFVWPRLQALWDLAGGQFDRYSGAFEVRRRTEATSSSSDSLSREEVREYWTLTLPEGTLFVSAHVAAILDETSGGAVDYAPRSKVIFEIRDNQNRVVYRASGYSP